MLCHRDKNEDNKKTIEFSNSFSKYWMNFITNALTVYLIGIKFEQEGHDRCEFISRVHLCCCFCSPKAGQIPESWRVYYNGLLAMTS